MKFKPGDIIGDDFGNVLVVDRNISTDEYRIVTKTDPYPFTVPSAFTDTYYILVTDVFREVFK